MRNNSQDDGVTDIAEAVGVFTHEQQHKLVTAAVIVMTLISVIVLCCIIYSAGYWGWMW